MQQDVSGSLDKNAESNESEDCIKLTFAQPWQDSHSQILNQTAEFYPREISDCMQLSRAPSDIHLPVTS